MGLFGEENPIIRPLSARERDNLEATYRVINAKIQELGGLQPRLISSPMTKVSNYGDSDDYAHRFVVQWKVPNVPPKILSALEMLAGYFYAPNVIQGRSNPFNGASRPLKYRTISGARSHRKYGYLIREVGAERLGSTGIWICREFDSKQQAQKAMKRDKKWLYHDGVSIELREADKIAQLDFAEQVVQIAHVLKHGKPADYDRIVYDLYRAFSRIGLKERTEHDIAGLEHIIDFMKWTLFATGESERAAEYFHTRPESVLLAGVKGTGKTLIAEMLAVKNCRALFVPVSATQLVEEKYASKGRNDFEEPKPTLFAAVQYLQSRTGARVFLHCDDIEAALLSPEGAGEQHLATNSTLLNKLSGIRQSRNTTLSGSTNDPQSVDDRFLRFGRIGYVLHVPLPNYHAMQAALRIHTSGMPLAKDVRLDELARKNEGNTPATLAEICNRAGHFALRRCAERRAKATGKDPFEVLPTITGGDLKDETVKDEDFWKAHELVSKHTSPKQNIEADRRIKAFCESFNPSGIGFTRN